MARPKHPLSLARWKYNKHKALAKFRNIGFHFTFEDWYQWWLNNGVDKNVNTKWNTNDRLCMCRYNDAGDYIQNNVYLATNSQNSRDLSRHIREGVKNQPKCRPQTFRFRWGTELVKFAFFEEKGIPYCDAINYFSIENYDNAKKIELKKLKVKFIKTHGLPRQRIRWEGKDGKYYNLLKDAANSWGIAGNTYRERYRRGEYTQHYEGPTLMEFVLANSRYPDPLLPDNDEC